MTGEFEDDVQATYDEAKALLLRKHADYGPDNIGRSPGGPLNGLRVRMWDKQARINNLIDSGATPENESLRDSFLDLANYGIIALLVLDGHWPSAGGMLRLPHVSEEQLAEWEKELLEGAPALNTLTVVPDPGVQVWQCPNRCQLPLEPHPHRAGLARCSNCKEWVPPAKPLNTITYDQPPLAVAGAADAIWQAGKTEQARVLLSAIIGELTEAKERAEAERDKAREAVARRDDTIRTHAETIRQQQAEIENLRNDVAAVQQTRDLYKRQRDEADAGRLERAQRAKDLGEAFRECLNTDMQNLTVETYNRWMKLLEG